MCAIYRTQCTYSRFLGRCGVLMPLFEISPALPQARNYATGDIVEGVASIRERRPAKFSAVEEEKAAVGESMQS